jgi:8-oxo-dGTP diphosphatase
MTIPTYVLGFAFNREKTKVLLIKKNRPTWQAGLFNGIGGKIEVFDVFPIKAMIREFIEETGLSTTTDQWNQYATLGSPNFQVTCYWSILDNINDYKSITDEEVLLVDIQDLFNVQFKNCLDNLLWLIPMALERNIEQLNSANTYSF